MKRKFYQMWAFALMYAGVVSCGDEGITLPKDPDPIADYGSFQGQYKAFLPDGTLSKEGRSQGMRLLQGSATDTLYMDQISFTDKVPYAFDIRFNGIRLAPDGTTLVLATPTQVPEMMWKGKWTPMEKYTISAFNGRFSADSLYLEFKCGTNLLQYAGKYVGK